MRNDPGKRDLPNGDALALRKALNGAYELEVDVKNLALEARGVTAVIGRCEVVDGLDLSGLFM